MPAPSLATWRSSENGFSTRWGFPNCVGAIDGKHVRIQCPPNTGSSYISYKGFFSVVLLAVEDPNYKFLIVDIGNYGRHSDSGIFKESNFYQRYISTNLLPPPKPLPGKADDMPHVLVGDEGFALQPYMMRPYPKANSVNDAKKTKFNTQLSRARRIVENAFGILSRKWRIFLRAIECNPQNVDIIVQAACCLHNFLLNKGNSEQHLYESSVEDETIPNAESALAPMNATNQRSSIAAQEIRNLFSDYFSERDGQVPEQ
ncbi:uncharacterized protein LOC125955453 [Anopheles darlingi]|uniref:uncharacterized protein LOC125955453 n=1 Tax=Anopheles darlingi TaxID=43151 RepID=UPI0021001A62|nr:uncharacterized protein LOC125955453 [Anopheles darlingi]